MQGKAQNALHTQDKTEAVGQHVWLLNKGYHPNT
jgi:hypothetical protein